MKVIVKWLIQKILCRKAMEIYGFPAQAAMVVEECSELTNAICKFRRGSCCIKKYHQTMNQTLRGYWYIDDEIPIFTGEGRDYIEKLI